MKENPLANQKPSDPNDFRALSRRLERLEKANWRMKWISGILSISLLVLVGGAAQLDGVRQSW